MSLVFYFCVNLPNITPCDSTVAEKVPWNVPTFLCFQMSYTLMLLFSFQPSSWLVTVILAVVFPRFSRMTAMLPSLRAPAHSSRSPRERNLCPWIPSGSWLTAIASSLVRMRSVSADILRKSQPIRSGDFIRHQRLKWVTYSAVVIPPFPT